MKDIIDYSLEVKTNFKTETIDITLSKTAKVLSRWIFNTREKALREALIALGWTPPPTDSWWCESHNREATHRDIDGEPCCDPKLGGILLPCLVRPVKSQAS